MAARNLLLEIGLEELPASFIEPALDVLAERLTKELKNNLIEFGPITKLGTPRRLAIMIADLAEAGRARTETATGPPKRAAFDADGNPTKAGLGFAKSQGVEVDELMVVETPKGEYLAVEKNIPGQVTAELLSGVLPKMIATLPFPKSMRWGSEELRFARPIHWLVALYGEAIIPFVVAGQASGRTTFGHRFMGPGPIELAGPEIYIEALNQARVSPDPEIRKRLVRQAAEQAAEAKGGRILEDEPLVGINANLVEWVSAVCGEFDREFLVLPDEVLITAMREHQKYFAVTDEAGKLVNLFVAINNTIAHDPEVVTAGHQKVIRARLSDAAFFFEEDTKRSLESRVEDLKAIVYHKMLGTSHQKMERFKGLAEWLAEALVPEKKAQAAQTAELAKADLVTLMVGEFPSLQGVIGRAYALKEGLDQEVADGIRDHYRPTSADGVLPESETGALVGLADKMDTIAGMFAIGKPPTGGADPFALRRAALGIIRVLIDRNWSPSLEALVDQALAGLAEIKFKGTVEETKAAILEFFRGRLLNLFTSQGFSHDSADAVLAVALDDPAGAKARVEAVQDFKSSPKFAEGAVAFKRLFNILKGQDPAAHPNPALFERDEERNLHAAYEKLAAKVDEAAGAGDYTRVLDLLADLRPVVDAFFEAVMVMAEDEKVKDNRLALVGEIAAMFRLVADFSRLQTS